METKSSKDGQAYKMDGKSKEVVEDFSQKANGAMQAGAKAVEKGLNDVSENMMDVYLKQLQLMNGFCNQAFSPLMGNPTNWNASQVFGNSFLNNDVLKMFSNSFNGMGSTLSNPFLSSFEQMFRQMTGSNNNLFPAFNGQSKINMIDWSAISKKIQAAMESRLEVSKSIFTALSEAHSKKVNLLRETNKEEMEKISAQVSLLMKQNQQFFTDLVEAFQAQLTGENKNNAESTFNNNKRFNSPVR